MGQFHLHLAQRHLLLVLRQSSEDFIFFLKLVDHLIADFDELLLFLDPNQLVLVRLMDDILVLIRIREDDSDWLHRVLDHITALRSLLAVRADLFDPRPKPIFEFLNTVLSQFIRASDVTVVLELDLLILFLVVALIRVLKLSSTFC